MPVDDGLHEANKPSGSKLLSIKSSDKQSVGCRHDHAQPPSTGEFHGSPIQSWHQYKSSSLAYALHIASSSPTGYDGLTTTSMDT